MGGLACSIHDADSAAAIRLRIAECQIYLPDSEIRRLATYADGRHSFAFISIQSMVTYARFLQEIRALDGSPRPWYTDGSELPCVEFRFPSQTPILPTHAIGNSEGFYKIQNCLVLGYVNPSPDIPTDNLSDRNLRWWELAALTPANRLFGVRILSERPPMTSTAGVGHIERYLYRDTDGHVLEYRDQAVGPAAWAASPCASAHPPCRRALATPTAAARSVNILIRSIRRPSGRSSGVRPAAPGRRLRPFPGWRLDDLVADALMSPLGMVVLHVLLDHILQVPLAEDQHPIGHFGAGGQHEALREAVRPRTSRRDLDHLDARVGERVNLAEQITQRADALIEVVQATAEVLGESPEFTRIVNSLAGDRDVKLLLVAAGRPLVIVAGNRNSWAGLPLSISPVDESLKVPPKLSSYETDV